MNKIKIGKKNQSNIKLKSIVLQNNFKMENLVGKKF